MTRLKKWRVVVYVIEFDTPIHEVVETCCRAGDFKSDAVSGSHGRIVSRGKPSHSVDSFRTGNDREAASAIARNAIRELGNLYPSSFI